MEIGPVGRATHVGLRTFGLEPTPPTANGTEERLGGIETKPVPPGATSVTFVVKLRRQDAAANVADREGREDTSGVLCLSQMARVADPHLPVVVSALRRP
jgi:hypothetical protein